jgi:hypothetical protein
MLLVLLASRRTGVISFCHHTAARAAPTKCNFHSSSLCAVRSRALRPYRAAVAAAVQTEVEEDSTEEYDAVQADEQEQPVAAPKAKHQRRRLTTTGGLKGLPVVTPAYELLSQAVRKSKNIRQDMEVRCIFVNCLIVHSSFRHTVEIGKVFKELIDFCNLFNITSDHRSRTRRTERGSGQQKEWTLWRRRYQNLYDMC